MVRSQYNVSAKSLIAMAGISAATYMRWKRRLHRGDEPLRKPGVKKAEPIDLGELRRRIGSLRHGKRRTAGTGQLYGANNHRISGREFNEMVREVRNVTHRQKAACTCQVVWLRPNVAWALDGLEYQKRHF